MRKRRQKSEISVHSFLCFSDTLCATTGNVEFVNVRYSCRSVSRASAELLVVRTGQSGATKRLARALYKIPDDRVKRTVRKCYFRQTVHTMAQLSRGLV